MRSIDLNADLGEGFGVWRMGDDEAMLGLVTSANIACGFHAGDPEIMAQSFRAAKEAGVAVGAHVSFPDLSGFGRRALAMTPAEIEHAVAYQIGAAQALARLAQHDISYVKAHGALANLAERDARIAQAIADAVAKVDASLTLLAIARSEQGPAATKAGLEVAQEIFADRAYAEDGRLAPRREAGSVLHDSSGDRRARADHAGGGRDRHALRRKAQDADQLDLRAWRHARRRFDRARLARGLGGRRLARPELSGALR